MTLDIERKINFSPLNDFVNELQKGSLNAKLKNDTLTIKFKNEVELKYFLSKIGI
ncbi:MAG: hypothetical protein HXX81_00765 [Campylobacterales bacterium]|nr:hypothetical protein [Campylobacterales bacterium]